MRFFYLFVSILLVHIDFLVAWDQVSPKCFRAIFPRINESAVWSLTFQINHQDSANDSIAILESWLNLNWPTPIAITAPPMLPPPFAKPTTTTKKPKKEPTWEDEWFQEEAVPIPFVTQTLRDREFARRQAIGFIEHRWTIKMYIRHLFRALPLDKRFSKSDALKMREIFWTMDTECLNYFQCTASKFINQASLALSTDTLNQYDIRAALRVYSTSFYRLPPIGEKLDWELQDGTMPGEKYYQYGGAYYAMFHSDINLGNIGSNPYYDYDPWYDI